MDGSVAIVGLAGRFPGARSPAELWKNLRQGLSSIRRFTPDELRRAGVPDELIADPAYVPAGGWLADIDKFDAAFFGMSPRDAAVFDPQHRFFLEVAWEAFEDAGYPPDAMEGAVGVFAAQGMSSYLNSQVLRNRDVTDSMGEWLARHTGNDPDFLATRVSYELDLRGPSFTVQTACSSSLVAIHLACQSLLSGECDVALAGGSTIDPQQDRGYLYREGEILAPDGHCRPFDARAQGTVNASACAAVVLKRVEDALRDGDCIRAVVLGSAVNNDGSRKVGYLAPSVDGQARAVSEALSIAGIAPRDVSFVEAHGTATLLGDPIELAALAQVFGSSEGHRCAIGSVKSNVGHAGETASIVGLIKAVLALQHRLIPPTVHFERPNPQARLDGKPFWVPSSPTPWDGPTPRRAGVSGLGAGGTNCHVVLEEAPDPGPAGPDAREAQILVVSARTAAAADAAALRLADRLEEDPAPPLADAAYTLQVGRKAFSHRRGVVASCGRDAAQALRDPARRFSGEASGEREIAFLFPGGGAQHARMGLGLHASEPVYRAALDECLAFFPPAVRDALFAEDWSPAARMEAPSVALPALFATEVALCKLLESWGLRPAAVLGHSAGEYAAACAASVLGLREAAALVLLRGQLFETLPPGGMLSVPLPEEELLAMLAPGLSVAAVNGPALSVASGPPEALARLEEALRARGVEASRVHIDVAAHSAMVDPILPAFERLCRATRFQPPSVPYLSNVSGTWVGGEVADPAYWVRHLRNPVRFAAGLRALLDEDRLLLEVGPGRTLASLARQQGGAAESAFRHPKEPVGDMDALLGAMGRLWSRGARLDWSRLHSPSRRRVPLPTYPFEGKRHWVLPTEEPAGGRSGMHRRPDVGDWFSAPAWHLAGPPSTDAASPPAPGPWLVLDDGGALGDALVRAIGDGEPVVRARPGTRYARDGQRYTFRPAFREDVVALFEDLARRGLSPRRIVHLLGAGRARGTARAAFAAAQEHYDGLVFLGQVLAGSTDPVRLVVVTSGLQDAEGTPVTAPERALLLGPVKVLPREVTSVSATAVDVPEARGAAAVQALAAALLREGRGTGRGEIVALRGGRRHVQSLAPVQLPAAEPGSWLERGGAVLITGGLGGIGLVLAEHLARNRSARLALVGRSAPSDAQRERMRALEALGAEVLYLRADAADPAQLRSALAEARRRFGLIACVVHAAGALHDVPMAARGSDTGRSVIAGKGLGALLLHELTGPETRLVLFSSVASHLGLPGQVDYTAANAFLDALAKAHDDRVVSLGWNAWQEVGLALSASGAREASSSGAALDPDARIVPFTLDRARDWVVGEHVIRGGEAVVPGTGIVELFASAMGPPPSGSCLELRDVAFVEPFEVPAGGPVAGRVAVSGDRLVLTSEPAGKVCATARGSFVEVEPATRRDLEGLRLRCSARRIDHEGRIDQPFVDTGRRWACARHIGLGDGEALAELELPADLRADLAEHPLHPGLLDLATGSAQALAPGFQGSRDFFVPLSYRRVLVRRALPARFHSHIELRPGTSAGELVFDCALVDDAGDEIVRVEGYELHLVGEGALTRTHRTSPRGRPSPLLAAIRAGIRSSEGMDALDRVLSAGAAPHLFASSVDPTAWKASVDAAAAPRTARNATPETGEDDAAGESAPRTEMELALAALWRDLLGVERPARDDHFFDLGGDSLTAVRISVALRGRFGVELPLAALFEAPTLAGCAALLDRARGHAGDEAAIPLSPASGSGPRHLVRVQPGAPGRTPFFCVHGAGGNVLNFRDFAQLLPELPVFGLQAQGLDGRTRPHASIEEMAAAYLAEIRAAQPRGPYLLGGYSGGGVVAYEIARELTAAGEEVDLLAFLDSFSPLLRVRKVGVPRMLGRLWTERAGYVRDVLSRRRERGRAERNRAAIEEAIARGDEVPLELREEQLTASFDNAVRRYRPRPWDGGALLLRAQEVDWIYAGSGPTYGWEELMPGRVDVVEVPGNHATLLLGANARVMVATLGQRTLGPERQ